jgi:hypothetical protein
MCFSKATSFSRVRYICIQLLLLIQNVRLSLYIFNDNNVNDDSVCIVCLTTTTMMLMMIIIVS